MRGVTLIELMLALFISTLILSSLMTIYLAMQSTHQQQVALTTLMENSNIAFHLLSADIQTGNKNKIQPYFNAEMKSGSMGLTVRHLSTQEENNYFISRTKRNNYQGDPIYALYRRDNQHHKLELVEGVDDMQIQYTVSKNNQLIDLSAEQITNESRVVGLSILLKFTSLNPCALQKSEFMYVSL